MSSARDRLVVQRLRASPARSRRTLQENIELRVSAVVGPLAALFARLDPGSTTRQRLLRRSTVSGWAAVARGDLDLTLARYAPDIVSQWPPDLVALGLPEEVEGKPAYKECWRSFRETWSEYELTPWFILDLGRRVVVLGQIRARGAASGAEVEFHLGQVLALGDRDPRVQKERFHVGWPEALSDAGVDVALLPEIEALAPGTATELKPAPKNAGVSERPPSE